LIKTIFNFSPLLTIAYFFSCFFVGEVELNFSDKTGIGGGSLGVNFSKKNGKTVIVGGRKAACTAFSWL
jgi:hypothetical protein